MNAHVEELESLLFDWESGTLESTGVERIREILQADENARTWFVRQQMISAALRLEGDAGLLHGDTTGIAETESGRVRQSTAGKHRRRRVSAWAFVAAALLICIQAGRILYLESARDGEPQDIAERDATGRDRTKEATSQGIALVTRLVDIQWNVQQSPLDVGDALTPGRLAIDSGYAQIEFFCGATVVVEGPAELELVSPMLARVHSGRLRTSVPPAARGFALEVDDMKVVDLGTEFGLSISPEGADLQVFAGEVELHQPAQQKQNLTAGQAIVRSSDGAIETVDMTPDQFLDIATLESHERGQQAARFQRWKSYSERLRKDDRLIAYYAFDQEGGWERKLRSDLEPLNAELDGAIVGAQHVSGRWNQKKALEFKRPGDRVRVQIPGEYSSLTFACWVRIDSLDRWYNSLFLTDGYEKGEPHWQILDTGQLFFSVRPKSDDEQGPEHHKVLSRPFWNPSLSGKWLHLATTYSVDEKRVTHYLNGAVLHRESIPDIQLPRTTRIGAATIGNWSSPQRPDAHFAIRNLNGSIDELAVFAAALTADEITEMYDYGRP